MKSFLKLGRWCHPSSEHYKNKCNQLYKMALANSDSCSVSHYNMIEKPKVKKLIIKNEYKNSIMSLLYSYFGN